MDRPSVAAGLLLALGGCATARMERFIWISADPAAGQPYDRVSNGEADTDTGDMQVTCEADHHRLELLYYWAVDPVRTVTMAAGRLRRITAVAYDPDGMGVARSHLDIDDPIVAAMVAGRTLALRYDNGMTIRIPASTPVRRLLSGCRSADGPRVR